MQKKIIASCAVVAALLSWGNAAFASKHYLDSARPVKHHHTKNTSPASVKDAPGRAARQSKRTSLAASQKKAKQYRVAKRDTLESIASRFNCTVADLRQLNHLRGHLKKGQLLKLPAVPTVAVAPAVQPTTSVPAQPLNRYVQEALSAEREQQLFQLLTDSPQGLESTSADGFDTIKRNAFGLLGTRYVFGGSSRSGIDCSAFVQTVFKEAGTSMPRTAREQFRVGDSVPVSDLRKGDLVFFRTYASFPSHVGIYLGNNRIIHASSREHKVTISPLDSAYFRQRYIGAKRIGADGGQLLLSELESPLLLDQEEKSVLASAGGMEAVRSLLEQMQGLNLDLSP